MTRRLPAVLTGLAFACFSAACASTRGGVPKPFPTPAARAGQTDGYEPLVLTALSLRGTPYRNGGTDPRGFDCSGFTQYVFHHHGLALPRDVHDQFKQGVSIRPDDLAPGDLVFFSTTGPGATHVGVVVSREQFVHAPSSTGVVRVENLRGSYWAARYVGARRIGQAALN
jgi:cell wall-associated NlpC family hydrolase